MSQLSQDELRMLAQTVAKVLTGTERSNLVTTLDELGWFDLWREQPAEAAAALFRQQGTLAVSSPMIALLMGAELVAADATASGPPALFPSPSFGLGGWALDAEGTIDALVPSCALDNADNALLAAHSPDGPVTLRLDTALLKRTAVNGLDPELGLCAVRVTDALTKGEAIATGRAAEEAWERSLALGRCLLAEELVGVTAEQQRLTLEHARLRHQFGRPIGIFQAVRHKLAEVHVALTSARLATEEAWIAPSPTTAALATLLAAGALELANGHCQQVLGGIGFTWEHPFHRYMRRGRTLAALLGTRTQLATELGERALAGGLPELAAL